MKNFIFNVAILMSLIIFLVLVYNLFDDLIEVKKKNNAADVIESPIQLEKPRYKLRRYACDDYVCDPQ